jgi:hypothetical protein
MPPLTLAVPPASGHPLHLKSGRSTRGKQQREQQRRRTDPDGGRPTQRRMPAHAEGPDGLGRLQRWLSPSFNPWVRRPSLPERRSLRAVDLGQIVRDFALAMEVVDHRRPQAASHRDATRLYPPGIGPFGEDAAVAMTLAEMQAANAGIYATAGKRRCPGSSHVCDLAIGALPDWAIEDPELSRATRSWASQSPIGGSGVLAAPPHSVTRGRGAAIAGSPTERACSACWGSMPLPCVSARPLQ